MILLRSPFTDAALNLALEEYAFSELDPKYGYFMLWQNEKSVIIGKHQNARDEVDLTYAAEHGIPVVRRLSGGGAVYHDLGNLNFTFIEDGDDSCLSMERFTKPLLAACRTFGIRAEIAGINDVTVGGRKFSGNAGYQRDGRILHHGTVLITTDIETMAGVLTPSDAKLRSNGVGSVRERVVNLSDCCPGLTVAAFARELGRQVFGTDKPAGHRWSRKDLGRIRKLSRERYETLEWNQQEVTNEKLSG